MRVPLHIVLQRRERLAALLHRNGYMPVAELCAHLGISEATARRDLAALEKEQRITRTYGGALADFNVRFPSFRQRQTQARPCKNRVAQAARRLFQPGQTVYFDTGTTIFALAESLAQHPVTPLIAVSNNLPAADLLSAIDGVTVSLVAGQLFQRQSALLGETARNSLALWRFDAAFLSAEGMTRAGLWNSQADIVAHQRAVLARSARAIFCIDSSKLGRDTPEFLAAWDAPFVLVTDASPRALAKHGIHLPNDRLILAKGRPFAGARQP